MKYYKRYWNEDRIDEFGHWGTSTWHFEVDEKGYPSKQVEQYENGKILQYDLENPEDEFGRLGDQVIDFEEFVAFEITKEEFIKEWIIK